MQPMDRIRRIAIEGSPTFYFSNSSISASGIWAKEFEGNTAQAKYLPFDTCIVQNTSNSDIQIELGANTYIVVANSVKNISDIAFRRFIVTNLDTTNSIDAGKLRIGVSLAPLNIDKAIRYEALKKFSGIKF